MNELRRKVAELAKEAGSPLALSKRLGVNHATVYRFLEGKSELGRPLGRALYREFADLRPLLTSAMFGEPAAA